MTWEILVTTYEVAGLVKAPIHITEAGIDSAVEIEVSAELKVGQCGTH